MIPATGEPTHCRANPNVLSVIRGVEMVDRFC